MRGCWEDRRQISHARQEGSCQKWVVVSQASACKVVWASLQALTVQ